MENGTMKRRRFFEALTATLLAVLIGAVLAAPAMAQGKGGGKNKDGGGGGGGDGPPVQYKITWLGNLGGEFLVPWDINNGGDIVGRADDSSGTVSAWVLLPEVVDGILEYSNQMIVTIDSLGVVPEGYRAVTAWSINEFREVTGRLVHETGVSKLYKLDLNDLTTMSMDIIDDYESTGGSRINNWGEICYSKKIDNEDYLHVYNPADGEIVNLEVKGVPSLRGRFNDSGQILGWNSGGSFRSFRYTPGEALLSFDGLKMECGPNESGDVALYEDRMNWSQNRVSRYTDDLGLHQIGKGGWPTDFNNNGDVVSNHNWLYRDDFGVLYLDDLVVGLEADLDLWFARRSNSGYYRLNDRNETNPGTICGRHRYDDGTTLGFVLTPIVAP